MRLSDAGARVLDACRSANGDVEAEQPAELDQAERTAFRRTLDRLAERTAPARGGPGAPP